LNIYLILLYLKYSFINLLYLLYLIVYLKKPLKLF